MAVDLKPPRRPIGRSVRRGVSLVEALVALLVMSIGMLALVGVQSTLRENNELSRQRAEAARIAAEDVERLRFFASVNVTAPPDPNPTYSAITALPTTQVAALPGNTNTTTFSIARRITQLQSPQRTQVQVEVTWRDRNDNLQSYSVDTVIAGVEPILGAMVMRPASSPAFARPGLRNVVIPPEAKDFGSTSGFKPPNGNGLVWVFNNATGLITSVCTGVTVTQANLTSADLVNCTTVEGYLVAGSIQFNLRGGPVPLGGGSNLSVYKPVDAGTAVWVLDDTTRQIVKVCTGITAAVGSITAADVISCPSASGSVAPYRCPYSVADPRYPSCADDTVSSLQAFDSESPQWPSLNVHVQLDATGSGNGAGGMRPVGTSAPDCFDNAPTTSSAAVLQTRVDYFCLVVPVYASGSDPRGWGGRLALAPQAFTDAGASAWTIGAGSGQYKVCRYTTDPRTPAVAPTDYTFNRYHPRTYCIENPATPALCPDNRVKTSLANQNYLVIHSSKSCPTDTAVDVAAGNLINSNTRQHQP